MLFNAHRLDGEVAFVTGASSGIGAAIAHHLASLGASLVLGARREDRLAEVAKAIMADHPKARVTTLTVDVRDRTSLARFVEDGEKAQGPCSILVNNAGLAAGADPFITASIDDHDQMIDTNLRAVVDLSRLVVPGMVERNRGDIVVIASVAGVDAYPGGSLYCATKAAVLKFAAVLRKELLGKDIRVLSFNPGLVQTEFALVRFKGDADKAKGPYRGMTPLSAHDVADCVAFALTRPRHVCLDEMLILATDQSSATTVFRRE